MPAAAAVETSSVAVRGPPARADAVVVAPPVLTEMLGALALAAVA